MAARVRVATAAGRAGPEPALDGSPIAVPVIDGIRLDRAPGVGASVRIGGAPPVREVAVGNGGAPPASDEAGLVPEGTAVPDGTGMPEGTAVPDGTAGRAGVDKAMPLETGAADRVPGRPKTSGRRTAA